MLPLLDKPAMNVMFHRWGRGLVMLVIAAAINVVALPAMSAEFTDPQYVLSLLSTDNQNANIATSPDGNYVIAVWDGLIDGQRRILLRERVQGIWSSEVSVVDDQPAADNQHPVIAVDPAGNYHVAWLGRVGGKFRVFYANRQAGVRLVWGAIDGGERPEDNCKSVVLRLDDDGRPWIAWQSGSGSSHAIMVSHLDSESGQFAVSPLTVGANNYNLYPEIVFSPDPTVLWYADLGDEVVLLARKYNSSSMLWDWETIDDLAELDTARFPFLFEKDGGLLAALWPGQVDSRDQVFLGLQGKETQGEGSAISTSSDSLNDFISGVASADEVVAVWRSWTVDLASQIYLSHGTSLPFSPEQLVSDGQIHYYSNPRVAALPTGAAIVWQSTEAEGGNGSIYFRTAEF